MSSMAKLIARLEAEDDANRAAAAEILAEQHALEKDLERAEARGRATARERAEQRALDADFERAIIEDAILEFEERQLKRKLPRKPRVVWDKDSVPEGHITLRSLVASQNLFANVPEDEHEEWLAELEEKLPAMVAKHGVKPSGKVFEYRYPVGSPKQP